MSTYVSAEDVFRKALVWMARRREFYGHVIQRLHKIPFDGELTIGNSLVKTAAVARRQGGRLITLCYNRDFVLEQVGPKGELDRVVGLIEHEVLHICLRHHFLPLPEGYRRSAAVDCAVNSLIDRRFLPNGAVVPETYELESGKSALWYYNRLPGLDEFEKEQGQGRRDEHETWKTISADAAFEDSIVESLQSARQATSGRGWGDVPGDVQEMVLGARQAPSVPWNRVVRGFCASISDSDLEWTMRRRSRRFGTRPGTRKAEVSSLAVVVDTSASISKQMLETFFSEVRWLHETGSEIWVIEADAKVQTTYRYDGRMVTKVHGGGGTNLKPALDIVEDGRYDGVVYFTDFYAPKVEPNYRTPALWVLTPDHNEDYPCEWGRRVVIGEGIRPAA